MILFNVVLLFLAITSSLAEEETINVGPVVKCGRVKFKCAMTASFKDDCSEVTEVVPRCTPKNKKCTKGVSVSFATKSGCTVSGTFKSTGRKQTFTQINISPPPLEEIVNVGEVKCGKVTYQQCKMKVTYKDDCNSVSKVVPNCTPKKSKCTKGVSISFHTQQGCTVIGMYKNTGRKQSMSKLAIGTSTSTTVPVGSGEAAGWTDWGEWSACNTTSPFAMTGRYRHCMNSPTASACDGDPFEMALCKSPNTTTSGALLALLGALLAIPVLHKSLT